MIALIAFLGGALTILSPCTLPVLPFVFARTGAPFVRSTLPLLLGMALTFVLLASLAAVGGNWAVRINSAGRIIALLALGLFGLALLSRSLADRMSRPAVALANRIMASGGDGSGTARSSLLLGVATGLLWAPCAGPILGLILTGAALQGPTAGTSLLLACYAVGAASALALATLAGRRVYALLRRSTGWTEWLRRASGALVLIAVAGIALGWDVGFLTRLSSAPTVRLEQSLIALAPGMGHQDPRPASAAAPLASLDGAVDWLNSPPLTAEALKGRVVLIDFWTYSCINCLRSLPYVKAWWERYHDHGLVIIGAHSPEFAFERDTANVARATADLGIGYPVAVDSRLAIWRAFGNRYWPAHYLIDAGGTIRDRHFGEGDYAQTEQQIRALLREAGQRNLPPPVSGVTASGVSVDTDTRKVLSPETYVGYLRSEHFAGGDPRRDQESDYQLPPSLALNQWALAGRWRIGGERAVLTGAPGQIAFRFHARDLHLVMGPAGTAAPGGLHFRVLIDGHAPGPDHGMDTDAEGNGTVQGQRLYQLIRQSGGIEDRTFTIEFQDPGVAAYSFTFG